MQYLANRRKLTFSRRKSILFLRKATIFYFWYFYAQEIDKNKNFSNLDCRNQNCIMQIFEKKIKKDKKTTLIKLGNHYCQNAILTKSVN